MTAGPILALSGSLRRDSVNTAVLRAAVRAAAPVGVRVALDDWPRRLPQFDPDLETAPPAAVVEFRAACARAAGVLVAMPEYAFGIPGAFKNALDWTVRSGSLSRKPLTVLDVSPAGRGAHARRALELVLQALDADVVRYDLPLAGRDPGDRRIVEQLQAVVAALAARCLTAP